jgi:surface antigen
MIMAISPRLVGSALLALALVGCAGSDLGPKQTVGTLVGAGTGALIGAQIGDGRGRLVATSVGTLLGAYLGNEAGKSLDRADEVYASRAETAARTYSRAGSATPWHDPDLAAPAGTACREFRHEATTGGPAQDVYVTACRGSDGRWQVVN